MYLTADIGHIIDPFTRTSNRASRATRFLSFIEVIQEKIIRKLNLELDSGILALEGIINRIDIFDSEQAEKVIIETSKAIVILDKVALRAESSNYFDSKEVKEKIKYAQKCLYKIESKLHRKIYKDKSIFATPVEIKDGISKLNAIYSR